MSSTLLQDSSDYLICNCVEIITSYFTIFIFIFCSQLCYNFKALELSKERGSKLNLNKLD
jgi:hypothetical protein